MNFSMLPALQFEDPEPPNSHNGSCTYLKKINISHFEITIFIYKSKPLHTKMLCGNISTTLFIVDCKSLSKTTSYSFYGLWASFFSFFYSFTCWDFKTGKNVLGMLTTNQMNDFTSPRPTFHNRYIVTL